MTCTDIPVNDLESAEDERAKSCRQALAARKPDPGRALAVAAGAPSAQPDGEIGSLRQLSQVAAPDQEQVDLVGAALLEAADPLARTADSDACPRDQPPLGTSPQHLPLPP